VVYERATGDPPTLISAISVVAVSNGALTQIVMASRVMYGLSRRGWLPVIFGRVNATTRTPLVSTGVVTAIVLALAVAQAVPLDPAEPFPQASFCQRLVEAARTEEIRSKMELVRDFIAAGTAPADAADAVGRTIAVHESMPFAVYAFLRHPDSFEDCLLCAALNGGDRDTLAAMGCAISGAYLGIEAVPEAWRRKLERRAGIEALRNFELLEMYGLRGDGFRFGNRHELVPTVEQDALQRGVLNAGCYDRRVHVAFME